jgi:hypothetical protein
MPASLAQGLMLPPHSRFRSCQDRATESMLPKNRNLTIFWTFYQPRQSLNIESSILVVS